MSLPEIHARFDLKFTLPERPGSDMPTLPLELDDLTDASLMSVYSETVAWVNYAKAELAKAEILEEGALSALRQTEAEALLDGEDPCVFVVRVLTT